MTFSPAAVVAKNLNLYREVAANYGYTASDDQLGWSVPIYVAESDAAAVKEARVHIENFRNKFLKMTFERLIPPGYTSISSHIRMAEAKASIFAEITIEKLMELGMFICGSPSTVTEQLTNYRKDLRFNTLVALFQFGTLPPDLTRRNMELFARELLPKLQPLGEVAVS